MALFQKPEHLQKLRTVFDQNSSDGKNLVGLKAIRSFFTAIGLNNQLFFSDLYYFFPELQTVQNQQDAKLSFEDCYTLIDFLVSKKNSPKHTQEFMDSFKVFDKNGNGSINANDLLPSMKKYLDPQQFQQFSQIITSSFGPSINYLEIFKGLNSKHN